MRRAAGFTLVELVTVMILIGILAAVAIPRMTGLSDYRALEFRDKTVAALRYAQKTATSHRRHVCVAFTASTVTLTIAKAQGSTASCNENLVLPGAATNILTSSDTTNAVFASGHETALAFLPDGTGADRTLTIAGQTAIVVQGATGYVQ